MFIAVTSLGSSQCRCIALDQCTSCRDPQSDVGSIPVVKLVGLRQSFLYQFATLVSRMILNTMRHPPQHRGLFCGLMGLRFPRVGSGALHEPVAHLRAHVA